MRDGHLEGRGRIAGQRVCRAAAPDAVFPRHGGRPAAEADAALSCLRPASSIHAAIPSGSPREIRNLTRVGWIA